MAVKMEKERERDRQTVTEYFAIYLNSKNDAFSRHCRIGKYTI